MLFEKNKIRSNFLALSQPDFINIKFKKLHEYFDNQKNTDDKIILTDFRGANAFDLAKAIISKKKNVEIIISSFNVNRKAIVSINECISTGIIKKTTLILNQKIRQQFTQHLNLFEHYVAVFFAKIHAKIILLKFENQYITILTSANLSATKNYEFGIIITNEYVYQFYEDNLKKLCYDN